jgi:hypothetical protein
MNLFKFIPYKRFLLSHILLFNRKFIFNKQSYPYFLNPYNASYANERAVEISIFKKIIKKNQKKKILEIGNVLSHYLKKLPHHHTIVDKYEEAIGVINEDALTYKSKKKFNLIIAVSTFEHIGFNEEDKDKNKISKVIKNLLTMLNKNGQLIFSVPIGHNPYLDKAIKDKKLPLTKSVFLKRNSKINTWIETDKETALKQKYNSPYPNANAIMVGFIKKS